MGERNRSKKGGSVKEGTESGKWKFIGLFKGIFKDRNLHFFILPLISIIIAISLFPSLLFRPKTYSIGDIADRDIKASSDYLIEDKSLTQKHIREAVNRVLAVYDLDPSTSHIFLRLKDAFKLGREFISFVEEKGLSQEIQSQYRERFYELLDIDVNNDIWEALLKAGFPKAVEDAIIGILDNIYQRGLVDNMDDLKIRLKKGGIVVHNISDNKERVIKDPAYFYDLNSALKKIRMSSNRVKSILKDPELTSITLTLCKLLLRPNLTFNQRETEKRRQLARESVKPSYFKVKKGEMIVREGERIGPEDLLKLSKEMGFKRSFEVLLKVVGMSCLLILLFFILYYVMLKEERCLKDDRNHLLFLSLSLLVVFACVWIYNIISEEMIKGYPFFTKRSLFFFMPIGASAMLVSIFQGANVAIFFSLIISVLIALTGGGRIEYFLYFFLQSLIAIYGVRDCTQRGVLIKTGLKIGLLGVLMGLLMEMIYGEIRGINFILTPSAGLIGGIISGVVAAGLLPLVEMAFGFTTDIRLLELANLDQPLLKELMVHAPGTYHHSLIISNMVEATAKAIGANPLLAKVSAYYHDIGKIKKPLYFIENQMDGINKHEKLAPSMSSLILISHVKDGVELAKRHKLGKEICDIIQQHHGTSLITYFYQKAKEKVEHKDSKQKEINEEDFRYPGPKPQTKEAGLVMLADMVEAASRSLKDPTPARIKGMVQKIINKAFTDGQLNECEITLKDLHEIAKGFIKTLTGIFHQRIEYPEEERGGKRSANGHPDQQTKADSRGKDQGSPEEIEVGIRRLGI